MKGWGLFIPFSWINWLFPHGRGEECWLAVWGKGGVEMWMTNENGKDSKNLLLESFVEECGRKKRNRGKGKVLFSSDKQMLIISTHLC